MKTYHLLMCILLFFVSSCASEITPEPTATAVSPTPTPWPTPDHSLTAVSKREASQIQEWAVLALPGMENVTIANMPYKDDLTVDFYYPPDFNFDEKLPVVLFVNGFRPSDFKDLKDTGWYVSWGQLVAASDMLGVNYEVKDPNTEIHDVITFIQENSDYLRADAEHICVWSSSGNTPTAVGALINENEAAGYKDAISCFVVFYGLTLPISKDLPPNIPIFIAQAGLDRSSVNQGLDTLAAKAKDSGATVEMVINKEGEHGFDIWNDTDESRAIIEQTLAFMKKNLRE